MAFSSTVFLSLNYYLPQILSPFSQIYKPRYRPFRIRCSEPIATSPHMSSSFDLRSYWTSMISHIEADLDAAIPIAYPEKIYESMRYSVLANGAKRASPIMCIATCELVGGDRSIALPTASALEMVHTASLIHDDLPCMDAAPLRRGRPSNHALFGVDLAVLTGDALFPLAFRHVVGHTSPSLVPPQTILRVIGEIARTVGSTGMAAGQMFDLLPAYGGEQEDAMIVLEKKFGEMAECSAVCGGYLGGAGEEEVERLRRYGRAVGVLYEVVDDILMEEEKGVVGNGRSGKMRSNASLVRTLGMERAMEIVEELREKAKKELKGFGDKYGDRVLPLYSFVDYAVERGFTIESQGKATAAAGDSARSSS
ncbi:heterodimeric geranylgeranyl pyrophosphate synthase small subunit, chloroplastic [Dendrobium catenatum]|uniref:Chloroplastic heterodimeric geranylgeranyl pyrophosphate synthase small subunit n=2 Tax=Dendrobium TaxID=37818 RepID=A0A7T0BR39_DENNO|nr:heterodimeric geranylgeranyl pyrophosphate synthase small subunit, chloroplastic [Dendrobium catenatum]PKU77396.1 Heterodimeric geranylgeranyl pyrophosphate synthase small subunit, chloroplastic [Dendrobium catenatum]QPJ58154.1 chloroplastic heterodimeric geranylgeranyl pyrophosphate synthase small subunit [Dendrobium nobile]